MNSAVACIQRKDVRMAKNSDSASIKAITKQRLTHDWTGETHTNSLKYPRKTPTLLPQNQEDNNGNTHMHALCSDAHGDHIYT